MVRAGAGAKIFDKLEPEPKLELDKNGSAPQHCFQASYRLLSRKFSKTVYIIINNKKELIRHRFSIEENNHFIHLLFTLTLYISIFIEALALKVAVAVKLHLTALSPLPDPARHGPGHCQAVAWGGGW
jgi:hypothetical protein